MRERIGEGMGVRIKHVGCGPIRVQQSPDSISFDPRAPTRPTRHPSSRAPPPPTLSLSPLSPTKHYADRIEIYFGDREELERGDLPKQIESFSRSNPSLSFAGNR